MAKNEINALVRVENINKIYKKLVDDKSKMIFASCVDFIFENDSEKWISKLWDLCEFKTYKNDLVQRFYKTHNIKKNIVFGAGKNGREAKNLLKLFGVEVEYFCDNDTNKMGTIIDGVECLKVSDVCQNYRDYNVIIASGSYRKEMYEELSKKEFPLENVLYLRSGKLLIYSDNQYFDFNKVVPENKHNVFVDAGCYDGDTTKKFIDWCNGKYDKVYCFEPDINNLKNVKNNLEKLQNIKIINAGTWSNNGKLYFSNSGGDSSITEFDTGVSINVTTIDNEVGDDEVTYIKMDVEGAELESIIGAQNTIKRCKPDLAICLYHNRNDFIDLPAAILELVPEYNLAIRHYSNVNSELVLYAYVDKK